MRLLGRAAIGLSVIASAACAADSKRPPDSGRAPSILEDAAIQEKAVEKATGSGNVDSISVPATLQGILQVGDFFGPPNYGENPSSDQLERQFYLQLPVGIPVQQPHIRLGSQFEERDGLFVQPVFLTPELIAKARLLEGKRVRISGTLEPAHTGHHRTSILLVARSIDPVTQWSW